MIFFNEENSKKTPKKVSQRKVAFQNALNFGKNVSIENQKVAYRFALDTMDYFLEPAKKYPLAISK